MINLKNPILNTDSYKLSHFLQYPEGVNYVTTYIEPRKSKDKELMFFGLQMFLKDYLMTPITQADIEEAEPIVKMHGEPFNRAGFQRIVDVWNGYWPIRIQALPEGTITKASIPQVQITNLDPQLPWVSTFIETPLIRATWYPSSVATKDLKTKKLIKRFLDETADNDLGLPFKLHDFGARGASSFETAGIGGCAHLVNFMGTDTVTGLLYAMNFYNTDVCGFSIPAAEHSTIISWGRERETDAYRNMMKQFDGEGKLFAAPIDSYDIWVAVKEKIGGELKAEMQALRGKFIQRPDSGDPTKVPAELMNALGEKFGYTLNTKGYKMLPPFLGVIQGDGVDYEPIRECLNNVRFEGWSTDNLAFGEGHQMLQNHARDDHYYAYKPNAVAGTDKNWVDVSKNPVGDPSKKSKAGRQAVIKTSEGYKSVREEQLRWDDVNYLRYVWDAGLNHKLLVNDTMLNIRKLVDLQQ